jgi:hypothetical protein
MAHWLCAVENDRGLVENACRIASLLAIVQRWKTSEVALGGDLLDRQHLARFLANFDRVRLCWLLNAVSAATLVQISRWALSFTISPMLQLRAERSRTSWLVAVRISLIAPAERLSQNRSFCERIKVA